MALAACLATASQAAEIRVISANGMREVLAETHAKFEADTRHQLTITVVETGEIRKRVLAGENFDVIMVPRDVSDEFEKAGKIVPGSAVQLIRVNFGLAVPNDGPRPDVSTPEALKRTLLAAKTVLITDPATGGISGVHFMEVLGKLGIADEMKGRSCRNPAAASTPPRRQGRGRSRGAGRARNPLRQRRDVPALPGGVPAHHRVHGRRRLRGGQRRRRQGLSALHDGHRTDNAYSAHCLTRG